MQAGTQFSIITSLSKIGGGWETEELSYVLQRAKPTLTRPREYLILERRKQEELREEANAIVNYNKQFDLKVCAATAALEYNNRWYSAKAIVSPSLGPRPKPTPARIASGT